MCHYTKLSFVFFFFNDTPTTEIYTLSLHDALPILRRRRPLPGHPNRRWLRPQGTQVPLRDRKSTRLNSSHITNSYAVFCLQKTLRRPTRPSPARHAARPHTTSRAPQAHKCARERTSPAPHASICAPSMPARFFFNDTATTEIYPLSLHDALPICTLSRDALLPRSLLSSSPPSALYPLP